MYIFFKSYADSVGAPSFVKFAESIGVTLADLKHFRVHSEFDRSYRECSEIRRDYLIDNALGKKQDATMTRFILSAEYGMGDDKADTASEPVVVTVEVIGDEA